MVSYTQATALRPDYAEAHNSLGITLRELGSLDNFGKYQVSDSIKT